MFDLGLASKLINGLQQLRDELDIDDVCPVCNGVTAHYGHCITFEIDNLLVEAKAELKKQHAKSSVITE